MLPARILLFIMMAMLVYACKTGGPLFGKKNFHQQYADKLKEADLHQTALGNQWFAEAEQALSQPLLVRLPYNMVGFFPSDDPTAIGIQFDATRGEKLLFDLKKNPSSGFRLFVDLWEHKSGDKPSLLQSFDTLETSYEFEVERSARYILRLQPELLKSVEFNLSIHVGPTLVFPAASGRTQSFWGAERDGGNRSHEGIDIFAPRGTPALAAADGVVSRVDLNNLGGKVVFMRPSGKNLSLYYAHLDSQLVREGQRVKKGDTLGFIGNSGNARSTSPHLHFGIYALGGAIDPFPFVNPELRKAQPISQGLANGNALYRSTKDIKDLNIPKYQWFKLLARSAQHHLVELPTGNKLLVAGNDMQKIDNQLNNKSIRDTIPLLDAPFANAHTKVLLMPGQEVNIIAYHEGYSYVRSGKESGWLPSALVQ